MARVRMFVVVMAALGFHGEISAAQSLVERAAVVTPLAQATTEPDNAGGAVVIPAGTTIRMKLKSPINTVSANNGSGLYLETTGAVIQQNRVVIPAGTLVQGTVERQVRPGRVKGRGQLQFHFTTLILPNNYTASIAGSLQSLPGSRQYESAKREGAIQPIDQIDKDAASLVSSVMAGAAIGSVTHGNFRAGRGALIGAGFGLAQVLFKRGDDVILPEGTALEMILDRSLALPVRELVAISQHPSVVANGKTTVPVPEEKSQASGCGNRVVDLNPWNGVSDDHD